MNCVSSTLKSLFQFQNVEIDNATFRLHYKLTFVILITSSILVAWRQHFGTAIDCIARDDLPKDFINDYCYIHSTFSVKESWEKSVGTEIPYPGVDKAGPENTKVYHTYYQWVSAVLFLQALLFYAPRCFWKSAESGRIKNIIGDLGSSTSNKVIRRENVELTSCRVRDRLHQNGRYFAAFVFAEVLNIVNVICQTKLMDLFLGGKFFSYGVEMVQFSDWNWTTHYDPSVKVFPKMAKCSIFRYGRSGDVQRHDVLCLLPINILNEKIYIFLWCWFIVLAVVSGLSFLSDIMFCLSSYLRMMCISSKSWVEVEDLRTVMRNVSTGDCFIIRLLAQNLSSENFRDLMSCLARGFDHQDRSSRRNSLLDDYEKTFRKKGNLLQEECSV